MSTALRRKSATTVTASFREHGDAFATIKWRPLGHLLPRSSNGGWFQVENGIWQHFKTPPSEDELNEERAWLQKRREDAAKSAGGKA
jgi:hypothetical protein